MGLASQQPENGYVEAFSPRAGTQGKRPESKYVEANGIRHHYLAWGDPTNPPLVMMHGIGLCAQVWNANARDLSRDFHVIVPDLRGHGDTGKPGSGCTFMELGADVAALIQALGLERPFGVGHSAGGMALLLADSSHPGIVGKVALLDTRVGPSPMEMLTPEEQRDRMARTAQKRSIWNSRQEMYDAYRHRRTFTTWTDEVFGDYIDGGTRPLDDGRVEIKCPNDTEAAFYVSRQALDPPAILRGLGGDYLLLVGEYEGNQTEQDAAVQHLVREANSFRLKPLGKGSHFVPMEHPDLCLAEIRKFFG